MLIYLNSWIILFVISKLNKIALSWTQERFVNASRRVFAYIWCQIFFGLIRTRKTTKIGIPGMMMNTYYIMWCLSPCSFWCDQIRVITVFTVFRLLTDFVCLYIYEFWLSLCKIVRSSVILLLPLSPIAV